MSTLTDIIDSELDALSAAVKPYGVSVFADPVKAVAALESGDPVIVISDPVIEVPTLWRKEWKCTFDLLAANPIPDLTETRETFGPVLDALTQSFAFTRIEPIDTGITDRRTYYGYSLEYERTYQIAETKQEEKDTENGNSNS